MRKLFKKSLPFQSQSCSACCSNIGVQIVIVADYWLRSLYCGAKSNLFLVCVASEKGNRISDIDTILAFLAMPIISEKYNFGLV